MWNWQGFEPIVALWEDGTPRWYSHVVYPFGQDGFSTVEAAAFGYEFMGDDAPAYEEVA